MKRRISAAMMVSGTILLLISMVFTTVSFAAPDLGRHYSGPGAPLSGPVRYDTDGKCDWGAANCVGKTPGWDAIVIGGGQCKECSAGEDDEIKGLHCSEGTKPHPCGSPPCEPTDEVCDGVDNDCDGEVDEGLGTTTCGMGECEVTVDNCVGGEPQTCTPGDPSPEVCDGLDNDCDGAADEDLGTTTCGVGECEVTVDNCVGGEPQTCTPADPSPEVCDGLDNDCDGLIDEGGVCDACTDDDTRPCDTGQPGVCAEGTETCVAGQWSGVCEQNTQSSDEVCNGLDDDCDGSVDEGLGTTTCGVGECQSTVDNCVGGVPQECVPGEPSEEVCNGLDDDCDGSVDEGLGTTTCGVGECQSTVDNCVGGVPQECVPGEPSDEVCGDGLDNDCDGEIDEGCACIPEETQDCYPGPAGTEGVGLCQGGTQTCDETGQWGECVGAVVPTDEICDGLDNDCDGSVDDGLGTTTCGVGECEETVDNCVDGEPQECVPGEPTAEICDGNDNDCDGKIDEGGVCGAPPPEGPPEAAPTPTPTPVVEVLGVEELPTAGIMPVGAALPILPMIFSSLALIGGGLLLWGDEDE